MPSRSELHRSRRKRRSTGERILRWLIVLVVLLLVAVGLGFGYFKYQWGQIVSAPCANCVAEATGAPYNLLLIGSDSRVGETAAQAQKYGTVNATGGQRADTIKILHIDPGATSASRPTGAARP